MTLQEAEEAGEAILQPAVVQTPPYPTITEELVNRVGNSILLVCGRAVEGDGPSPPLLGVVTAFDIL